ncbi:MAG: hypothetical protein ACI8S6_005963, partial [Myxococcota bacterium]
MNLGGDSKLPTHDPVDHRSVSFIGRPFPLAEADAHFSRLRGWGLNCLRLLTTWEAIAHAGPDCFDEDYLDYFAAISAAAGRAGLRVIVDFHQDVFSRMTGGDGAPGWAVEAAGLDLAAIGPGDAAWRMADRHDPADPSSYPQMSWTWNYQMPANGILWTLFFAGDRLAPGHRIDGEGAGSFLRRHFFAAQQALAERLASQPWVIGFDVLNEPSRGWIGRSLTERPDRWHGAEPPRPGPAFSPLDALSCAAGHPTEVPWMVLRLLRGGVVRERTFTANPGGIRLWRDDIEPPLASIWSREGGQPRALKPDHFQQLDFERDCLSPFLTEAARRLHAVRADWLIFCEKDALDAAVEPGFGGPLPQGAVDGTHWYDLVLLMARRDIWPLGIDPIGRRVGLGSRGIERVYAGQLQRIAAGSEASGVPTFIGEFGIPFDLNGRAAYRAWAGGDRSPRPWRAHVGALQRMYGALDALQLSGALWNYTASNRNDHGDGWNLEDLSVFSAEQGGRAVAGFCRPYATAIQGEPEVMRFEPARRRFTLRWMAEPDIDAP